MVVQMMVKFTREQLYKEIWESSARQVAIKYRAPLITTN